jgi:hypothetical protein
MRETATEAISRSAKVVTTPKSVNGLGRGARKTARTIQLARQEHRADQSESKQALRLISIEYRKACGGVQISTASGDPRAHKRYRLRWARMRG